MSVHELLQRALKELARLRSGEEFLVRDLFKGYEWNRHPIGHRRTLGSVFHHEVTKHGNNHGVVPIGKSSANQQRYKKV